MEASAVERHAVWCVMASRCAAPQEDGACSLEATARTVVGTRSHGSRATCGASRVQGELRLGLGVPPCGRKRVARLMRLAGLAGVCHRCKRRGQRPLAAPHDLVRRQLAAQGSDRSWCTDITEHPTSTGKVYCAAVLDVSTRKVVGWSIADRMRSELIVDALQRAIWRRHPALGRSCTRTGVDSTRDGSSGTGCAWRGCSGRWAGSLRA